MCCRGGCLVVEVMCASICCCGGGSLVLYGCGFRRHCRVDDAEAIHYCRTYVILGSPPLQDMQRSVKAAQPALEDKLSDYEGVT